MQGTLGNPPVEGVEMNNRDRPNWLPKLMRAAEAQDLTTAAAVALAEVRHDDDCARLLGVGVCNCNPDVTLRSRHLEGEEP